MRIDNTREDVSARTRRKGPQGVTTGLALLPNAITLCAMGCGFYSLAASFRGETEQACTAILLAGLLDALDGWVARRIGSTSRLGTQLDCVSDFVSFCLAPAALVLGLRLPSMESAGLAALVFYVVCGGGRLIQYSRQASSAESRSFTGLPTTGAAILMAAGVLASRGIAGSTAGYDRAWMWGLPVLGVLMVSTLRFRSARELLARRRGRSGLLVAAAGLAFLILSVWVPVVILAGAVAYALWGVFEGLCSLSGAMNGRNERNR